MALFAGCWEARMRYWRRSVIKIFLMARNASRYGDVVVIVHVARNARRRHVRASQRKSRLGVIEDRWLPRGRVVAHLASLRKSLPHVIRILRVLEIGQVARNAGRDGDLVVVVDMAQRARRRGVGASQRKCRLRVIKCRWNPSDNRVTVLTGLAKPSRYVVGVLGASEILRMARYAGHRAKVVVIVDVAVGAGSRRHRVSARQQEPRSRVVKLRIRPAIRRVAVFAGHQEGRATRNVVRIRRAFEVRLVARHAIRRHRLELAVARVLVAGIAIHRGVRAS